MSLWMYSSFLIKNPSFVSLYNVKRRVTWLSLHVSRRLGLAAWRPMGVSLSGWALAVMVPWRISWIIRWVVASRSGLSSPSRWQRPSWGVVTHRWVFRMSLRGPGRPWLVWMSWRRGVSTGAALMATMVTGRRVASSVTVLILRPQIFFGRLVVIMVGVFDTVAAPWRRMAAVLARTWAGLFKPVRLLLAQMVGFGNREQITVNLHVVWRQRHAGWESQEGGTEKTNGMQQNRVGRRRQKEEGK